MLLQKESHSDDNSHAIQIKSYQSGEINVNGKVYSKPILLQAYQLSEFKHGNKLTELQIDTFIEALPKEIEIVLIGTGEKQIFLTPDKINKFNQLGIAIEVMATRQACHTFQVLTYEKRKVLALLYP